MSSDLFLGVPVVGLGIGAVFSIAAAIVLVYLRMIKKRLRTFVLRFEMIQDRID
jgi:hypothetical protein